MPNQITHTVGIIMNGVTGRMGFNQHLKRSVLAIMRQGGVRVSDAETFSVGSARTQMLKLAPLEGPWPSDTTLIRLDHCVTPCGVRSRPRSHRDVRRAAA